GIRHGPGTCPPRVEGRGRGASIRASSGRVRGRDRRGGRKAGSRRRAGSARGRPRGGSFLRGPPAGGPAPDGRPQRGALRGDRRRAGGGRGDGDGPSPGGRLAGDAPPRPGHRADRPGRGAGMSGGSLPGGRTHMCGAIRAGDAGADVALKGWVARKRDHGGVIFLDLRDREGVIQVVAHPEEPPSAVEIASRLRPESVIAVSGQVRRRPEGTANPELPTGEVEVAARAVEVLSESETPPFPLEDRIEVDEALRLK